MPSNRSQIQYKSTCWRLPYTISINIFGKHQNPLISSANNDIENTRYCLAVPFVAFDLLAKAWRMWKNGRFRRNTQRSEWSRVLANCKTINYVFLLFSASNENLCHFEAHTIFTFTKYATRRENDNKCVSKKSLCFGFVGSWRAAATKEFRISCRDCRDCRDFNQRRQFLHPHSFKSNTILFGIVRRRLWLRPFWLMCLTHFD